MKRLLWIPPSVAFAVVAMFAMRLERLPFWWAHNRQPCDYDALDAYMKAAYGA